MEDGVLARGPPSTDKAVGEAPFVEIAVGMLFPTRWSDLIIAGLNRPRGPDKLVLNSCVKLMKWDLLSADTSILGPDAAQLIIDL